MSLETQITEDMKTAMRSKDKVALEAIRAIKSALLLAKTDAGAKDELSTEEEIALLSRLKKQRADAAKIYRDQDREDLAEPEEAQISIIDKYLPAQMSDDEVKAVIAKIIEQTGATGMKDMGKVIGMANKEMAGKAEGRVIADAVKASLS